MDTSDTKACIQLEPTEILVWLKRVSGDNPVFLDPLTFRHLVVLARSWSCQPSIYGRSVFNLQKWTLPEYKERMKERKRGVEMKPVLLSECRVDLRFWTQRRMIRLRLDVSEICECDGQSHFKPSSGSVSLLWKELCKWLYVSVCGWKGRGLLLWNCVVNSLCLSADYSGMGLGLQAWENPLLSKVIQLWAQLLSNNYSTLSRRVSCLKPPIMHKTEQLILTDGFCVVVSLLVPRFVCPDLWKGVCSWWFGDESDR